MRLTRFAWLGCALAAFVTTVPACGGDDGGGGGGDDTVSPDADTTQPPDADNSDFTALIGRDWTIPPGERYKCVRIQVQQDMYIAQFRANAPLGTHHTVLTVSNGGSLGEYDCSASNLDLQMLFASGVGSDDLAFPSGVAIKVSAGQYLNLNLHLFNTTNGDISGRTEILVKTIPVGEVQNEAEMVFAGQGVLNIPGNTNGTPHVEEGGCTFSRAATLIAYWPHMHQYAVHQKVTLTVGGAPMVIHDAPYTFEEQKNYPITPIAVTSGDSISVECSYENDTGNSVGFGDSSEEEMCFTGLYRYPKQALYLFECTEGLGP